MLTQDKFYLHTQELVHLGITWFGCDVTKLEFEKQCEFKFIQSVLVRLDAGLELNFIIFKDATASALQLLTLVLGVKQPEHIQIFNLNSNST